MTDTQKKWAWIIGAVLIGVHFAPPFVIRLHQAFSQPAPALYSKPSPGVTSPVKPPTPPATPAELENARLAKLTGIWIGSTVRADRGSCQLRLQILPKPEKPEDYSGYSTMICGPNLAFLGVPTPHNQLKSVLNQVMPVSSIFSGSAASGAIELKLDQTVGATPDGCQLTSITLTPFGDRNVASTWTESSGCQGGQMVMRRSQR